MISTQFKLLSKTTKARDEVIVSLLQISKFSSAPKMSKSKFEYVKKYEADDRLLPNSWIVIRIDGKGFHKFSEQHNFVKVFCTQFTATE